MARRYYFARFSRATIAKLVPLIYRLRVYGAENLPESGAILSGNHTSYLDPVMVWVTTPKPTHYMGKSEFFENRFLAWALPQIWVFPIRRGSADREAIATASNIVKDGGYVGIFPEGTRNKDSDELAEGQSGAAFIAMRSGVPIVPFGLAGTDMIMPKGVRIPRFPRVVLRYGEPIDPASFTKGSRKERLEEMTQSLMNAIGELRAQAREER